MALGRRRGRAEPLLRRASARSPGRSCSNQALPPPHLRHRYVFSAFCVGLLGNAVLPGRVGEVARIGGARPARAATRVTPGRRSSAVDLRASAVRRASRHRTRHLRHRRGRIPTWALPGVEIVIGGRRRAPARRRLVLAWRHRRHGHEAPDEHRARARRLLHSRATGSQSSTRPARRSPPCSSSSSAGRRRSSPSTSRSRRSRSRRRSRRPRSCCSSSNVALAFPLWPGSVGLFQAAVALALAALRRRATSTGSPTASGSRRSRCPSGVGLGLLFLAREGISFAMLKQIPRSGRGNRRAGARAWPSEAVRPRPQAARPRVRERVGMR